jgi:hypothetical protein
MKDTAKYFKEVVKDNHCINRNKTTQKKYNSSFLKYLICSPNTKRFKSKWLH